MPLRISSTLKHSENEHLSLLLKVNEVLNSALSIHDVMRDLIRQVIEALGAERGFVVLRKDDDWQILATHYVDPAQVVKNLYFSRTIVSQVAESGQPMLCVDAARDDWNTNVASIVLQGIRSILCAPLRWAGKIQGVVYADNSLRAGQFSETHLAIFSAIADQASRNLEMNALQEQLRRVHQETLDQSSEGQAGSEAVEFALRNLEQEDHQVWNAAEYAPTQGLAISLFGPFRVSLDGDPIEDWTTRKNRELLAYLATHRGQVVHEEKLMDLFWSQGGKKGLHSLHNGITQLRKALRSRDLVERKLDGYTLGSQAWIDIEQFATVFREGRSAARLGRWEQALPLLGRAERLAEAEFMEGCYSEWTFPVRQRLEEQVQECRELLAKHFSQHGKHLVAIELWKRVLQYDRCREEAYRGLMQAYRALGRWSEVMRTYQACEKAFQEELDLPPPEDLRDLLEI